MMKIYYDSIQEGIWFQNLHSSLQHANLYSFPNNRDCDPNLRRALQYDRPDIVLCKNDHPILVIERTIEVPSGHNVGQRFARLVAAAQMRVPSVYFGPYAAYKHGGATQGPRYMNLRLFYAIEKMAQIERTAVSVINWPVDHKYEIIQSPQKDARIKMYMNLFFRLYNTYGLPDSINHIVNSEFKREQDQERRDFISSQVVNPEQYDGPPDSVIIGPLQSLSDFLPERPNNLSCQEIALYKIGMTYIRSDPYTGMAMLYSYLYCGGLQNRTRNLVLHFPNITKQMWSRAASGRPRKDIRLYRLAADGILFRDGYVSKSSL